MIWTTACEQDTEQWGRTLASYLQLHDVLGLKGDLGAGKTCFVRGLAAGLQTDPDYAVTSPTFTLANEYPGPRPLFHFDFYRLDSSPDLMSLGIDDYWGKPAIFALEWADQFLEDCPIDLLLEFQVIHKDERHIALSALSTRGQEILQALTLAEAQ